MDFLILIVFLIVAFLSLKNNSTGNKNHNSSNYTYDDTHLSNDNSYSFFDSIGSDFNDCDCGCDNTCDCDGGCD